MPILAEENFEAVRMAIAVELSEDDLPNAVIALPIYQGVAERWARSVDSTIETRLQNGTEDEKAAALNGVIFKTASLLVSALPFLQREEFGPGEGFTRQKVDKGQLAESLAARAAAELDSYLNPGGNTTTAAFLPAFAVAPGYRGR
ncbi:MAG TPA: hypothetical protein PLD20_24410 [Blastocatellia bacterium]|nr:hypothetical protein [Blastocatellia bacterium]HMV87933.1 hypothetical protein [Blastocatellia bacterium]HMX27515.1 hypothetical protein [Blastocatellia bacterium]HMY75191.1 hypothetical protein [Blastocatellia bacterium]HMZ21099.1 hypothetical protein [Blastocatellia bacterium]